MQVPSQLIKQFILSLLAFFALSSFIQASSGFSTTDFSVPKAWKKHSQSLGVLASDKSPQLSDYATGSGSDLSSYTLNKNPNTGKALGLSFSGNVCQSAISFTPVHPFQSFEASAVQSKLLRLGASATDAKVMELSQSYAGLSKQTITWTSFDSGITFPGSDESTVESLTKDNDRDTNFVLGNAKDKSISVYPQTRIKNAVLHLSNSTGSKKSNLNGSKVHLYNNATLMHTIEIKNIENTKTLVLDLGKTAFDVLKLEFANDDQEFAEIELYGDTASDAEKMEYLTLNNDSPNDLWISTNITSIDSCGGTTLAPKEEIKKLFDGKYKRDCSVMMYATGKGSIEFNFRGQGYIGDIEIFEDHYKQSDRQDKVTVKFYRNNRLVLATNNFSYNNRATRSTIDTQSNGKVNGILTYRGGKANSRLVWDAIRIENNSNDNNLAIRELKIKAAKVGAKDLKNGTLLLKSSPVGSLSNVIEVTTPTGKMSSAAYFTSGRVISNSNRWVEFKWVNKVVKASKVSFDKSVPYVTGGIPSAPAKIRYYLGDELVQSDSLNYTAGRVSASHTPSPSTKFDKIRLDFKGNLMTYSTSTEKMVLTGDTYKDKIVASTTYRQSADDRQANLLERTEFDISLEFDDGTPDTVNINGLFDRYANNDDLVLTPITAQYLKFTTKNNKYFSFDDLAIYTGSDSFKGKVRSYRDSTLINTHSLDCSSDVRCVTSIGGTNLKVNSIELEISPAFSVSLKELEIYGYMLPKGFEANTTNALASASNKIDLNSSAVKVNHNIVSYNINNIITGLYDNKLGTSDGFNLFGTGNKYIEFNLSKSYQNAKLYLYTSSDNIANYPNLLLDGSTIQFLYNDQITHSEVILSAQDDDALLEFKTPAKTIFNKVRLNFNANGYQALREIQLAADEALISKPASLDFVNNGLINNAVQFDELNDVLNLYTEDAIVKGGAVQDWTLSFWFKPKAFKGTTANQANIAGFNIVSLPSMNNSPFNPSACSQNYGFSLQIKNQLDSSSNPGSNLNFSIISPKGYYDGAFGNLYDSSKANFLDAGSYTNSKWVFASIVGKADGSIYAKFKTDSKDTGLQELTSSSSKLLFAPVTGCSNLSDTVRVADNDKFPKIALGKQLNFGALAMVSRTASKIKSFNGLVDEILISRQALTNVDLNKIYDNQKSEVQAMVNPNLSCSKPLDILTFFEATCANPTQLDLAVDVSQAIDSSELLQFSFLSSKDKPRVSSVKLGDKDVPALDTRSLADAYTSLANLPNLALDSYHLGFWIKYNRGGPNQHKTIMKILGTSSSNVPFTVWYRANTQALNFEFKNYVLKADGSYDLYSIDEAFNGYYDSIARSGIRNNTWIHISYFKKAANDIKIKVHQLDSNNQPKLIRSIHLTSGFTKTNVSSIDSTYKLAIGNVSGSSLMPMQLTGLYLDLKPNDYQYNNVINNIPGIDGHKNRLGEDYIKTCSNKLDVLTFFNSSCSDPSLLEPVKVSSELDASGKQSFSTASGKNKPKISKVSINGKDMFAFDSLNDNKAQTSLTIPRVSDKNYQLGFWIKANFALYSHQNHIVSIFDADGAKIFQMMYYHRASGATIKFQAFNAKDISSTTTYELEHFLKIRGNLPNNEWVHFTVKKLSHERMKVTLRKLDSSGNLAVHKSFETTGWSYDAVNTPPTGNSKLSIGAIDTRRKSYKTFPMQLTGLYFDLEPDANQVKALQDNVPGSNGAYDHIGNHYGKVCPEKLDLLTFFHKSCTDPSSFSYVAYQDSSSLSFASDAAKVTPKTTLSIIASDKIPVLDTKDSDNSFMKLTKLPNDMATKSYQLGFWINYKTPSSGDHTVLHIKGSGSTSPLKIIAKPSGFRFELKDYVKQASGAYTVYSRTYNFNPSLTLSANTWLHLSIHKVGKGEANFKVHIIDASGNIKLYQDLKASRFSTPFNTSSTASIDSELNLDIGASNSDKSLKMQLTALYLDLEPSDVQLKATWANLPGLKVSDHLNNSYAQTCGKALALNFGSCFLEESLITKNHGKDQDLKVNIPSHLELVDGIFDRAIDLKKHWGVSYSKQGFSVGRLDPAKPFTLSFWLKPESASPDASIVSQRSAQERHSSGLSNLNYGLALARDRKTTDYGSQARHLFLLFDNKKFYSKYAAPGRSGSMKWVNKSDASDLLTCMNNCDWVFVAISYDGAKNLTLYASNKDSASLAMRHQALTKATNSRATDNDVIKSQILHFGAFQKRSRYGKISFKPGQAGAYDEIRIFDSALSKQDLLMLKNMQKDGKIDILGLVDNKEACEPKLAIAFESCEITDGLVKFNYGSLSEAETKAEYTGDKMSTVPGIVGRTFMLNNKHEGFVKYKLPDINKPFSMSFWVKKISSREENYLLVSENARNNAQAQRYGIGFWDYANNSYHLGKIHTIFANDTYTTSTGGVWDYSGDNGFLAPGYKDLGVDYSCVSSTCTTWIFHTLIYDGKDKLTMYMSAKTGRIYSYTKTLKKHGKTLSASLKDGKLGWGRIGSLTTVAGSIDELRFFQHIIDMKQITALRNRQATGNTDLKYSDKYRQQSPEVCFAAIPLLRDYADNEAYDGNITEAKLLTQTAGKPFYLGLSMKNIPASKAQKKTVQGKRQSTVKVRLLDASVGSLANICQVNTLEVADLNLTEGVTNPATGQINKYFAEFNKSKILTPWQKVYIGKDSSGEFMNTVDQSRVLASAESNACSDDSSSCVDTRGGDNPELNLSQHKSSNDPVFQLNKPYSNVVVQTINYTPNDLVAYAYCSPDAFSVKPKALVLTATADASMNALINKDQDKIFAYHPAASTYDTKTKTKTVTKRQRKSKTIKATRTCKADETAPCYETKTEYYYSTVTQPISYLDGNGSQSAISYKHLHQNAGASLDNVSVDNNKTSLLQDQIFYTKFFLLDGNNKVIDSKNLKDIDLDLNYKAVLTNNYARANARIKDTSYADYMESNGSLSIYADSNSSDANYVSQAAKFAINQKPDNKLGFAASTKFKTIATTKSRKAMQASGIKLPDAFNSDQDLILPMSYNETGFIELNATATYKASVDLDNNNAQTVQYKDASGNVQSFSSALDIASDYSVIGKFKPKQFKPKLKVVKLLSTVNAKRFLTAMQTGQINGTKVSIYNTNDWSTIINKDQQLGFYSPDASAPIYALVRLSLDTGSKNYFAVPNAANTNYKGLAQAFSDLEFNLSLNMNTKDGAPYTQTAMLSSKIKPTAYKTVTKHYKAADGTWTSKSIKVPQSIVQQNIANSQYSGDLSKLYKATKYALASLGHPIQQNLLTQSLSAEFSSTGSLQDRTGINKTASTYFLVPFVINRSYKRLDYTNAIALESANFSLDLRPHSAKALGLRLNNPDFSLAQANYLNSDLYEVSNNVSLPIVYARIKPASLEIRTPESTKTVSTSLPIGFQLYSNREAKANGIVQGLREIKLTDIAALNNLIKPASNSFYEAAIFSQDKATAFFDQDIFIDAKAIQGSFKTLYGQALSNSNPELKREAQYNVQYQANIPFTAINKEQKLLFRLDLSKASFLYGDPTSLFDINKAAMEFLIDFKHIKNTKNKSQQEFGVNDGRIIKHNSSGENPARTNF